MGVTARYSEDMYDGDSPLSGKKASPLVGEKTLLPNGSVREVEYDQIVDVPVRQHRPADGELLPVDAEDVRVEDGDTDESGDENHPCVAECIPQYRRSGLIFRVGSSITDLQKHRIALLIAFSDASRNVRIVHAAD